MPPKGFDGSAMDVHLRFQHRFQKRYLTKDFPDQTARRVLHGFSTATNALGVARFFFFFAQ
jgi:hypothetical protein